MSTLRMRRLFVHVMAVLALLGCAFPGCEYPSGAPMANTPPETQLSNVPANDTIAQYLRLGVVPELTLNWLGNDPDGYVVGFGYRWTDIRENGSTATTSWSIVLNITTIAGLPLQNMIQVKGNPQSVFRIYDYLVTLSSLDDKDVPVIQSLGDSLATLRAFAVPYQAGHIEGDSIAGSSPDVNKTPTRGTFIFGSPDSANRHVFEVRAIDNKDAVDPTPAVVNFWTLTSPGPTFRIVTVPPPNSLAINYPTERWRGLPFTFQSIDASTFDIAYQWSVDDTLHWSPLQIETTGYVTAAEFRSGTNTHILYGRARNRWGVLSPIDTAMFTAIVPLYEDPSAPRRILVINNDYKVGSSPPLTPDTNQVKAFYSDLLDGIGKQGMYDIWCTQGKPAVSNFPTREVVARYPVVLLIHESKPVVLGGGAYIINDLREAVLRDHLNTGGKLIISSPPDPRLSFSAYAAWSYDVLHAGGFQTSTERDFVGARARLGYPDVRLDTTKIHPDSVASNGVRAMRLIALHFPRGFGETIYQYDSATDRFRWENGPLGIRFLAPPGVPPARQTYSVVFFGFPLYLMEKASAQEALRKAFQDLNE